MLRQDILVLFISYSFDWIQVHGFSRKFQQLYNFFFSIQFYSLRGFKNGCAMWPCGSVVSTACVGMCMIWCSYLPRHWPTPRRYSHHPTCRRRHCRRSRVLFCLGRRIFVFAHGARRILYHIHCPLTLQLFWSVSLRPAPRHRRNHNVTPWLGQTITMATSTTITLVTASDVSLVAMVTAFRTKAVLMLYHIQIHDQVITFTQDTQTECWNVLSHTPTHSHNILTYLSYRKETKEYKKQYTLKLPLMHFLRDEKYSGWETKDTLWFISGDTLKKT